MTEDNPKNQWDDSADAWADFVRTGLDYTREYMNNPAMFEMLGNIKGKRILDLACGEGYNSRLMAGKGAKVTGVDFAKTMIDLAIRKEKEEKLGIDYYVSDASDLSVLKEGTFDIAACFMALQDIENYQKAVKEVHRVLKGNGRFVFVIPHPCFEVRIIDGRRIGGWVYEGETGVKDKETALNQKLNKTPLYYTIDRYFDTCSDVIDWNMDRLTEHFKTTAFHRTLTDYADALNDAGFKVSRLKEPLPTQEGLSKHPEYFGNNLRIPQSIVIEAVKPL